MRKKGLSKSSGILAKANLIGHIGIILIVIGCFCPFTIIKLPEEGAFEPTVHYFSNYISIIPSYLEGFEKAVSCFSNNELFADGAIIFVLTIVTYILMRKRKITISMVTSSIIALIFLTNFYKYSIIKEVISLLLGAFEVRTGCAVFFVGGGLLMLVAYYILYLTNKSNNKNNKLK